MNLLNKILLAIWLVVVAVLIYFTASYFIDRESQVSSDRETENIPTTNDSTDDVDEEVPAEKPAPEPVPEVTMELAMIGDVLLHKHLALYGDFVDSLSPIRPFLESPDFLIANQESPPTAPTYEISGYPQFSSPHTILRDLKAVGVDQVNLANNHIVDKGQGGVKVVFEALNMYEMPYVGAYQSMDDRETMRLIEEGDLKIGLLSYTYGTNGLFLPKDSPYIVNYIDEEKISADVNSLKPNVDVVVVLIHWGAEYATNYNDSQKQLATKLNEWGVDIVFGTHPHVLQPYEKLLNAQGNETHVFYSLGNFFATTKSSNDSFIGGIGSVQITKKGEEVTVKSPKLIATSMLQDGDGKYRVYSLAEVENRSSRPLSWVQQILGDEVIVQ